MHWYSFTRRLRSTDTQTLRIVDHATNLDEILSVQKLSVQLLRQKMTEYPASSLISAIDANGTTLFEVQRSEIDLPTECDDDEQQSADVQQPSNEMPERFLQLMIRAQESATSATRKALETMAEAMAIQNERNQDLLERYASMVQRQHDEIERLIEEKRDVAETAAAIEKPMSEIIENLVESLAPVVAPMLLQLQQQKKVGE